MTTEQLVAAIIGGLVLVIGASVPLILSKLENMKLQQDIAKIDLKKKLAEQAMQAAAEQGDHEGAKGPRRAELALENIEKLKAGGKAEAEVLVQAAVFREPGVGASSKRSPAAADDPPNPSPSTPSLKVVD